MIELLVVEEVASLALADDAVQLNVTGEETVELLVVNQPQSVIVVEETTAIAEVAEVGPQGPSGADDLDKTLAYNLDGTLHSITSANGTKTFGYTAGRLTSVDGTGTYKSKLFTYTGDQLTGIDVL